MISGRWFSKFLLNASSIGVITTSQSSWFHCCTTLTVGKFFLIFTLNLASYNLSPSLCVLQSGMIENRSCPSSVWQPFKYLKSAIISPLSLLFLKVKHAQFFQPFFLRLGFQPPDHPCRPPLNLFQFVSILLEVWCPDLTSTE